MDLAKPLPHELEAERALLGAIILDDYYTNQVFPILTESAFLTRSHKVIYRHMQLLAGRGERIDLVTLSSSLHSAADFEAAGGPAYLAALIDGVPKISNVDRYAKIVRTAQCRRELIHYSARLQQQAFEESEVPEAVIESAITELLEVSAGAVQDRPRSWNDAARATVREMEDAHADPKKAPRFLFGLEDLDEMTGGLRRGKLVLIVAPTSNGKSLLASQLVTNTSLYGFHSIFFSAEMSGEELTLRDIAYRAGVKFYFTQHPEQLTRNELDRLARAAEEPVNAVIVEEDVTPARVWAMSEAAKRTSGLDLLLVDYDQLVIEAGLDPKSPDENVFRHQRAFFLAAKRLAQRLDVCVVILGQLRKIPANVAKGAPPRLDDIWGDSAVRNTPQTVLWIKRDFFEHEMDPAYERIAHVYVLKNRSGRTGVVELDFDPELVRFGDVPKVMTVHVP